MCPIASRTLNLVGCSLDVATACEQMTMYPLLCLIHCHVTPLKKYTRHPGEWLTPQCSQNPGFVIFKKKVGGVGGIKFSHGSDLHLHNPWGNWDKHQNNCYYPWRGCFFSFQQWNSICCNQEWLLPWRGIILFCNKLSQKCWVSSLLNKHISKFKHTHFWSKPDSYEIFYI